MDLPYIILGIFIALLCLAMIFLHDGAKNFSWQTILLEEDVEFQTTSIAFGIDNHTGTLIVEYRNKLFGGKKLRYKMIRRGHDMPIKLSIILTRYPELETTLNNLNIKY